MNRFCSSWIAANLPPHRIAIIIVQAISALTRWGLPERALAGLIIELKYYASGHKFSRVNPGRWNRCAKFPCRLCTFDFIGRQSFLPTTRATERRVSRTCN